MTTYAAESKLQQDADASSLTLATALGATPHGLVDHPVFFTGFLAKPEVAAAGLLTVADVAMSHYADFGLAKRVANLDPLVTASGDRLRFESFSACNGVYARFDLLQDGVDSGDISFGTTNVDINQPLRSALARVARHDLLHLSVGTDQMTASSLDATHTERKVDLPERWVRGCAEVPAIAAQMQSVAAVSGSEITRFLGQLPSIEPPGPNLRVVCVAGTLRTTVHAVPGSAAITGTSRLRAAARISRHATRLTVYSGPNDTSAWVLEVPGGRLTLMLSPGPYRAFSGEGGLLNLLAGRKTQAHGASLLRTLSWTPTIDEAHLVEQTHLTPNEIHAGLAWLAASGRVGYDLSEQTRFHRDLPVDADKILRRSPRLRGAHRLVEHNAVTPNGAGWRVRGNNDTYDVRGQACSCPWHLTHGETRGPCKHVLAVALTLEAQEAPAS